MRKKLWYAVLTDPGDNDWGYGSFDRREAFTTAREMNDGLEQCEMERTAYVVAIDADYDESGSAHSEPIAVSEYHEGSEF